MLRQLRIQVVIFQKLFQGYICCFLGDSFGRCIFEQYARETNLKKKRSVIVLDISDILSHVTLSIKKSVHYWCMNAHILNWNKLLQTENKFFSTIIISVLWPKIWPKIVWQFETKSNNSTIKSMLKKPFYQFSQLLSPWFYWKIISCFESAWLLSLANSKQGVKFSSFSKDLKDDYSLTWLIKVSLGIWQEEKFGLEFI